ncbi:ZYRO0F16038p [Zygosaccharomyces rouxii]|uniref:DNA repair protein RAD50 n=2 Tax=Zygosaccharomyces rouxii TaxID=4956 RepID=C5DYV4_ZYGRC|nr:uncharacterized protein ZYRO0F16038g [Zygosaccharomyces rouxii]KAH9201322.1 DNA repair protein RAD50 [Zygosaccharomyces rouxii]CAQ43406.1 DNA repair protein RAD50 [Zygosaccharomyces rouxii]CAR28965.1 ZYRO0F16038p [Zygosaccharomyces rouxii]
MSAIYKLSIQGIRSFDSNDRETIQFGKPLTLIVGSNGSGKTTIIECLKYATTGDLPPNSKGGAFVHDPKITGEKDVRAQVKLAFTSANALNMIVTRNIQLLTKKTTATFKTLEGQLVIVNGNGDRNTLGTRSLELDAQVPLYLGVPKAILEYVIFCHQEDSLWPLSEPSNLKKKFDEIFQAMKFTRALDNLKGIKKDMTVDIKLLKQAVEHLKVDKDRSRVMTMNITRLQAKSEEYQAQVKEVEKQLKDITEQSDKLFKSNQDFQKVLSKLESLKNSQQSKLEQIDRLSNSIDPIDLGKEELENLLSNFSSSLTEKEEELRSMEKSLRESKAKAAGIQNKCNSLMQRQGELSASKENHERNKSVLRELQRELQTSYALSGFTENLDDFAHSLKELVHKTENNLLNFTHSNKSELNSSNNELSELNNSLIVQTQRLDYSKMDKQKLASEIQNLELQVDISDFTDEDLEGARQDLNKFSEKLKDWEKQGLVSSISQQIKEKNEQMLILEYEIEELQVKISRTNQQADLFAKLGLLKKSLQDRQLELGKFTQSFKMDSKSKEWGLQCGHDVDMDFKKFYINMQKNLSTKSRQQNELDKKFMEGSLQLTNTEMDLRKNEEFIINATKHLQESLPEDCTIDDYTEVVAEAEASYRTALENLKIHQTTLEFNKKALEVAKTESCCYLCTRKFDDEGFKSSILLRLQEKTDGKFNTILKESLESEKEYLNSLRNLEKDVISLNDSRSRITGLSDKVTDMRNRNVKMREELDTVNKELESMKEDKDHAEKEVRPLVENIVRLRKASNELESDIKSITDELAIYRSSEGKVETVEELQNEQRNKNESLRRLRKEVGQLQDERETKSKEHSNLLNLIREKDLKISEIEKSISMRKNLESDLDNKKNQLKVLEETVKKLEGDVKEGSRKVNSLKVDLERKTHDFEKSLDENNKEFKAMVLNNERFISINQQVKGFTASVPLEYEKCVAELESAKKQLVDLDHINENMNSGITELAKKLNDSNREKRNLKENLDLMELRADLSSIERQIDELDIQNAEAERDRYQQESMRLRSQFERLSSENAGKLGERKQLQNQIDSMQQQLRTDYKDVDVKYQKQWVELQAKTFVTDDIDTYSNALDSAIMRYHKLKMEDINRIIDELWKRTYSGTDVDTIQLRSEEVGSGVKMKSYNYRVVMFKQDAELDMRGRCSAGQKVLASIIIRLALSETFGVNCGVIALDEPTTNLDEENIESLARSLHNIIELRRHQKNFQLIVITHDEKFLNHMDASQFTDHFFKVKRDDRQKSQIEWVDINKVTD